MESMVSYITENDDNFENLINQNCFMGTKPILKNSTISFKGSNNILFCEPNVTLIDSKLVFRANNSLIYLSSNRHDYKLNVTINNNQVFFVGKNNYINGVMNIILSEQKHIFIGSDCLFSFGIWIRNADPHLIYNSKTMRRTNPTKSVFIGDHVWIGQHCIVLKGTKIGSGSIIGAMSLVSGKEIPSNTSWGGVPARQLETDIFWTESCVHDWSEKETQESQVYINDAYIFDKSIENEISFEEIDIQFSKEKMTSVDRLNYLQNFVKQKKNNSFVII